MKQCCGKCIWWKKAEKYPGDNTSWELGNCEFRTPDCVVYKRRLFDVDGKSCPCFKAIEIE